MGLDGCSKERKGECYRISEKVITMGIIISFTKVYMSTKEVVLERQNVYLTKILNILIQS